MFSRKMTFKFFITEYFSKSYNFSALQLILIDLNKNAHAKNIFPAGFYVQLYAG